MIKGMINLDKAAEESIPCPAGLEEPGRWLFEAFRDFTFLFKSRSGLDYNYLLPGIQGAAVAHFVKDWGKEKTISLLQDQIRQLQPALQHITPKPPPSSQITPQHITNMARFNELILRVADDYVMNHGCPPALTAAALSMLVFAIADAHYDLTTAMAAMVTACEEIANGKYDHHQQAGGGAHSPPQQQSTKSEQASASQPAPLTGTPEEQQFWVN